MICSTKELLDFSNKVVVVTGASQGIGAGIVARFAEAGAQVVVHYRSKKADALAVVERIRNKGGSAVAIQSELSCIEGCQELVSKTLNIFGRIDSIINNAGIFPNASLLELSLEDWQSMYMANVETAFLCTQAAALHMKENGGGTVVNLGSISALSPGSLHSHYNSAKAAVVMLTRSASQELGPYNIRVNAVSPGLIARPGIEEQWPEGVERWQQKAPLERMGAPEDIADACLFLTSPASRWITGHNLVVDGGMMNSMIY